VQICVLDRGPRRHEQEGDRRRRQADPPAEQKSKDADRSNQQNEESAVRVVVCEPQREESGKRQKRCENTRHRPEPTTGRLDPEFPWRHPVAPCH
jgi:hypothetical protein